MGNKQDGISEQNVGGSWFTKTTEDNGGSKRDDSDGGYFVEGLNPHDRRSVDPCTRLWVAETRNKDREHKREKKGRAQAASEIEDPDDIQRANKRAATGCVGFMGLITVDERGETMGDKRLGTDGNV